MHSAGRYGVATIKDRTETHDQIGDKKIRSYVSDVFFQYWDSRKKSRIFQGNSRFFHEFENYFFAILEKI